MEFYFEPLLDLKRLISDRGNAFYTIGPNYDIFIAIFNYLSTGIHAENIRYVREKLDDFYVTIDDGELEKKCCKSRKGRPEKLKPIE